jgi:hypothetical protein
VLAEVDGCCTIMDADADDDAEAEDGDDDDAIDG